MSQIVFPFGPQHPALPEAIQLKLTCEGEKVVEVEPVFGYMHRGIEKAAELNSYTNNVFLAERICGSCSFTHALGYCQLMEEMMAVMVPSRARYLRVVWSELSRMQSHLAWLGLLADSFGFESLNMECWRARETVLDMLEMTTGQRIIQSVCIIGGVRRDITPDLERQLREMLNKFQLQVDTVLRVFRLDQTIKARTVDKGVLPKDRAWAVGAVGPTLRGSGWAWDCRSLGYAAYDELDFKPVVESGGDCHARILVRIREIEKAHQLVVKALDRLPVGEIAVKAQGLPKGEAIMRVEQPRGELFEYAKGNGSAYLERLQVRTPTFANIPALLAILPGCELADVPVIIRSIDPCIACLER